MQRLLDIFRRPAVIRLCVALYVASLCVLIFIYFVISAMQVPTAIYLRGPERLRAGEPLVVRGHVIDVATGQKLRHVKEFDMALSCPSSDGRERVQLPAPEFEPDGELRLNHTLESERFSPDTPRTCALEVSLRREPGGPLFESSSPLTLLPVLAPPPGDAEPQADAFPSLVERRAHQEKERDRLPRLGVTRATLREKRPDVGEPGRAVGQEEQERAEESVRIDLVERYPVIGRGLPGHVTLRTTKKENGAPLSCEILFKTTRGILTDKLPASVRTDRHGLARVSLTPSTLQVWDLEADCPTLSDRASDNPPLLEGPSPDGSARLQIDVATTQFQFMRHKLDPLLAKGSDELIAGFSSVYQESQVVVDHYQGDTHLYTGRHAFRGHHGAVRVPWSRAYAPGLHRLQIYQDAYQPGTAWDILYVWGARAPQGANDSELEQAIEDLLHLHLTHADGEEGVPLAPISYLLDHAEETWRSSPETSQRRLFEALLHGLPPTFSHAPVLLNSFDLDQRELDAWKQSIRHDLLLAVAAALLTGLAMLSLAILSGISQRQARQRLYDEVAREHGEDVEEDEHAALAMQKRQRAEKIMLWVQGGVLFGTLVVFAACIWMLMRFMM